MKKITIILALLMLLTTSVDAQSKKSTTKKATTSSTNKNSSTQKLTGKALEYYNLAKAGDADAQCLLGLMYYKGKGVEQDYEKAAYWLLKAAAQGHTETLAFLGDVISRDDALKSASESHQAVNNKKMQDITEMAEQGTTSSTSKNSSTPKLTGKALEYYNKAKAGDAEAQYNLGWYYFASADGEVAQNYKQAVYWLQKAAEQGHAKAQSDLGRFYAQGVGVTQDDKQAVYWLQKAAEQGDAESQFILGLMSYNCEGVPQDYKNMLRRRYYNGEGVAQDYKQAIYWFKKAAELEHADAQCLLGLMYHNGEGVTQDYKQAVYWWQKAAEQEYKRGGYEAQFYLGLMYYDGEGVTQDYKQAVYWWQKAAEQGQHTMASYFLGLCYYLGEGVAQEDSKAAHWWWYAAYKGEMPEAQYALGLMYLAGGIGVPKDETRGLELLRMAAKQGQEDAQQELKELGESW